MDPPLAGVVLQKEPVPAWIPCGPQFLPETCSCVGSSNCSFLQGSSIHLLSVGAPRLPLWGSAPACSTARCRWRACFPLSKRTELLNHSSKMLIARLSVYHLMCVFTCTEPQAAGNPCSSAWTTSSCSSFMGLVACRTVPHSSPTAFFTP